MTRGRLLLAGACALAALYAAGLVYEMDFAPPVCCGLGWPHADPVASSRWQAAADPAGRNPAVQRGSALMQLAAEPADATAWMRLAWADWLQHRELTKAGASALDMSFLLFNQTAAYLIPSNLLAVLMFALAGFVQGFRWASPFGPEAHVLRNSAADEHPHAAAARA